VGSAGTSASVSIEVFVEGHIIAKIFVLLETRVEGIHLASPLAVLEKDPNQAGRKFSGYLVDGDKSARTGWVLDFEVVSIVVMELLQRFDDEKIPREPDRTTPVGVAAEQRNRSVPTNNRAVGRVGQRGKHFYRDITMRNWWAHQDLNLEPTDYESAALTIEL
jgi:hypothetical protein